jgi:hypothetical protein
MPLEGADAWCEAIQSETLRKISVCTSLLQEITVQSLCKVKFTVAVLLWNFPFVSNTKVH